MAGRDAFRHVAFTSRLSRVGDAPRNTGVPPARTDTLTVRAAVTDPGIETVPTGPERSAVVFRT